MNGSWSSLLDLAMSLGTKVGLQREPRIGWIVTVDGLRLRYFEWGSRDAPTVLMIHSGEEGPRSWDLAALALADDFRVIALESRGYGKSDRNADGRYRQEDYLCDVESTTDQLDLRDLVVVGQAWGARHAYLYAAQHPERVRATVVIDTAPEVPPGAVDRVRAFLADTADARSFEEILAAFRLHNPHRGEQHSRVGLRHEVERQIDGRWAWRRDLRNVLQERPVTSMESPEFLWRALATMRCPTLYLYGAESAFVSRSMADRIGRTLTDGRVVEVPVAGHLVAGDNPLVFEQLLLGFLAELG